MYDIIGDIHGHANRLEALLTKMDYNLRNGYYAHPFRKALFVGDYVDRGPKIRETLQMVRSMVEHGAAIALMGNHEYNALCFHFQEREGGHLRKHLIKNIIQHYQTLEQFKNRQEEYEDYLEWFKTLPLFYEVDGLRAVHASWDAGHIEFLKQKLPRNQLTDELIYESVNKGTLFNLAIEDTLKGKELKLPDGIPPFKDADGHTRKEFRVKWWDDFRGNTYKRLSIEPIDGLPEIPVSEEAGWIYGPDEPPVFFGHYWLKGSPGLFRDNICCVDYSVAKGGKLAAYRYDGEKVLSNEKWVHV